MCPFSIMTEYVGKVVSTTLCLGDLMLGSWNKGHLSKLVGGGAQTPPVNFSDST